MVIAYPGSSPFQRRRTPRGTGPRPGERSAPSGSPPDPLALTPSRHVALRGRYLGELATSARRRPRVRSRGSAWRASPRGGGGGRASVSGPPSWSPTSGFTARTAPPIRGFTEWARGVRNSLQRCYRPRLPVQIVSGRGVLASLRSGAFPLSPELKANCFCIHSSPPSSSSCACAFQSSALPCQQAGPGVLVC